MNLINLVLLMLALAAPRITKAWDPWNLAPTPPMGFANWNGFGCNYTDSTIRSIADALVATGMRDAGYDVVLIQECITKSGSRNEAGEPVPDPDKFPHGMKDLVDYIHYRGLRAGIYTDVGAKTCAGYEGSYGYEVIDALTYARWGIDLIEDDACYLPANTTYPVLYSRMRHAIAHAYGVTGHPMMLYMCTSSPSSHADVHEWGPETGTLWRTTGDLCPPNRASWGGVMSNFEGDLKHPEATGPGSWQDADMLAVGMSGLSPTEWRSHFSLWAMAASPLWAGVDLTVIEKEALDVFLNLEVVAVDQDPLGKMAVRVDSVKEESPEHIAQVWARMLQSAEGESFAAAVLVLNSANLHTGPDASVTIPLASLDQVVPDRRRDIPLLVRDLWLHQDLPSVSPGEDELRVVNVEPHGVAMMRLSQRPVAVAPSGMTEERGAES